MAFAKQYVRCGNRRCKSCPHGPYWYEFTWDPKRKATRSRYIGKDLPDDEADPTKDEPEERPQATEEKRPAPAKDKSYRLPKNYKDVFSKRTISAKTARKVMGVFDFIDRQALKARYIELAKRNHPDMGGNKTVFAAINAAWTYLDSLY